MSDPSPRLFAVIDPASPRYAGWLRDLGCDFVPVEPGGPMPVDYNDGRGPCSCYRVDTERLSDAQLGKIVRETARDNGVRFFEAVFSFAAFGMWVDEREVVVCADPAEGRLRFPFWSGAEGGGA